MPVEVAGPNPGDAATKKLLRSVFMKGWAAAVIESLEAAERVGAAEWLREEIAREFLMADESLVTRFLEGSRQHAVRRVEEMMAASSLLTDLGIPPRIADASAGWLRQLAGATTETDVEGA
jgi:3-hydroxyisobutyrate dehydrogenase-like beta-hydroxyacid dehydrogenase